MRIITVKSLTMRYLLLVIITICLFSSTPVLNGQDTISISMAAENDELFLPPLGALIDSAMLANPMVQYRNHEINARASNLETQKNSWIRNFGVQADMRYGTFDIFSTTTAEGQSPALYASRNNQLNYGVGAYLKFPLYDFVNRKNQVRQARAELDQASSMADAQRVDLRQMVIRQYNEVLLKYKLLRITSRNLSDAIVNKEMVETEVKNGQVPVSEYAMVSSIASGAEAEFETARVEFRTSIMLLEEMVGFKLSTYTNDGQNENY